jgi:uncharacterized membrane protein (UPF0136 family)
MKRFILCLALLVAMFIVAGQAHGLIIHESATLGTAGQDGGLNLSSVSSWVHASISIQPLR